MKKKMPPAGRNKERLPLLLAALLLVVVLAVLIQTVPGFAEAIFRFTGIIKVDIHASQDIDSATKIHVIDVGQGDATLLEQNGHFALIDAGPPEARDDLIAYLRAVGVHRLDYVIMTHPHADHIGGMQAVIKAFDTAKVILPDFDKAPYPTTSLFINLLQEISRQQIAAHTAAEGDRYSLGGGYITVLQAGLHTKTNYNLLSLVLLFEADGLRFIATGDAETANEKALLESGAYLRADILLLGHHGSSTSNTQEFIEAVNPAIAVASCAAGNSYGHPHREVLRCVEQLGIYLLRTDINGTAVLGPGEEGSIQFSVTYAVQSDLAAAFLMNRLVLQKIREFVPVGC